MSFRDFDAEQREVKGEPLTFRLGGTNFTCKNPIPIGIAVAVAGAMQKDELAQMATMAKVFKAIIVDEQADEWDDAVMRVTDVNVLQALLSWVVEESTGRPTPGPEPSSANSSGDGPTTKAASVSTVEAT